jgi:hypothetical protein
MEDSFIYETLRYARDLGPQIVNESEYEELPWSRDQWELVDSEFDPPDYDPSGEIHLIQRLVGSFPEALRGFLNAWAPLP